MHELEKCLLAVLGIAVALGVWSVYWVRRSQHPGQVRWGRWLFIGCLLALGAGNFVALSCAATCLVPYGLSSGWLVIAMLWENPFRG